jgi:hypothetical protein
VSPELVATAPSVNLVSVGREMGFKLREPRGAVSVGDSYCHVVVLAFKLPGPVKVTVPGPFAVGPGPSGCNLKHPTSS